MDIPYSGGKQRLTNNLLQELPIQLSSAGVANARRSDHAQVAGPARLRGDSQQQPSLSEALASATRRFPLPARRGTSTATYLGPAAAEPHPPQRTPRMVVRPARVLEAVRAAARVRARTVQRAEPAEGRRAAVLGLRAVGLRGIEPHPAAAAGGGGGVRSFSSAARAEISRLCALFLIHLGSPGSSVLFV